MRYSQTRALEAIKDSGGIKKNICARLDIARPTFDEWIAKYPVIAVAYTEEKEKLKDLSEERLIEQIQMGNLGAIIWYQKTQCRDRGYIEKVEATLSSPGGGPLEIRYVNDWRTNADAGEDDSGANDPPALPASGAETGSV